MLVGEVWFEGYCQGERGSGRASLAEGVRAREELDFEEEVWSFDEDDEDDEDDGDDDGPFDRSAFAKRGAHAKEIGKRGEDAAVRYLSHVGYEILERNWECPAGEADIIARQERTLVFVEVKTRTNINKGFPAEAVTPKKRARYEKIAAWYLREYDELDIPIRFDVVAIIVIGHDRAMIKHFVNAYASE